MYGSRVRRFSLSLSLGNGRVKENGYGRVSRVGVVGAERSGRARERERAPAMGGHGRILRRRRELLQILNISDHQSPRARQYPESIGLTFVSISRTDLRARHVLPRRVSRVSIAIIERDLDRRDGIRGIALNFLRLMIHEVSFYFSKGVDGDFFASARKGFNLASVHERDICRY